MVEPPFSKFLCIMCNNFPNIRVVEGNSFALLLPLKRRTYESCDPVDEDIDALQLTDVVVKFGGVVYPASLGENGVTILLPSTLARGTYDVTLTATYQGSAIRAAYESAVTIVAWNSQSDAQQYVAGSPIVLDAAYVIGGTLTDEELEELKEEYRDKIEDLDEAIEAAEDAKEDWEEKAAQLDGVAQEDTLTQGVTDIRADIANIDIDTSTLAKETTAQAAADAADAAKLAAQAITGYATEVNATANKNEIINTILANVGVPTLTIPDSTASQELAPNTLYVFASRTSNLTLTLGTPIVGIANEYHLFLVAGSTAPTITWPTGISWNGGSAPTIAADKTYEVSILNNIAAYFEV